MKVLFLSQWYPNRYDAMAGLFVRKHADAVSAYCEVMVLYVHADKLITKKEIITTKYKRLTEISVYYPCANNKLFYRLLKPFQLLNAYYCGYKRLEQNGFTPDIIHSNILTRTAVVGYILKKWKGIPYVITEHWSRYLPIRNEYKGILRKFATRLVVKNASAVMPVSDVLKQSMLRHQLNNNNYKIIYNVVDDFFFSKKTITLRTKKRIIHISCFDEKAKNISGILRTMRLLAERYIDIEFVIIGTGIDYNAVVSYSETLHFPKGMLQFVGEKTPKEVAYWLHNSDLFVLFSNFETAGIVIAESLVSGLPIISTNVGIAGEFINAHNGKLIEIGDEKALFNGMVEVLDNLETYSEYMNEQEFEHLFNYKSIGSQVHEIYQKTLNKH